MKQQLFFPAVVFCFFGLLIVIVKADGHYHNYSEHEHVHGGIRFDRHQELAIKIYQRDIALRQEAVKQVFGGDVDTIRPWEGHKGGFYLWDFFIPSFNCLFRDRLGKISEGGKVLCNPGSYSKKTDNDKKCVVFSFGVRGDVSFEIDLASSTFCTIYAFDPSVKSLPDGSMAIHPCKESNDCGGSVHFEPVGLGVANEVDSKGWVIKTLDTLMAEKGVDHVDILKVDIEGSEWAAINQMHKTKTLQKVDQLSIELHFKQHDTNNAGIDSGVREVFEFFENCEAAGLYAFSSEVNYNPSGWTSKKPYCIEYTLVRPNSLPMMTPPTERNYNCEKCIRN
jgi:hypothetical protein